MFPIWEPQIIEVWNPATWKNTACSTSYSVACRGSICGYQTSKQHLVLQADTWSGLHESLRQNKQSFGSYPQEHCSLLESHGIAWIRLEYFRTFSNSILSTFYQDLWVNMGQMSCVVQHVEHGYFAQQELFEHWHMTLVYDWPKTFEAKSLHCQEGKGSQSQINRWNVKTCLEVSALSSLSTWPFVCACVCVCVCVKIYGPYLKEAPSLMLWGALVIDN